MKFVALCLALCATVAHADNSIQSGTQSTAQQQSNVNNTVNFPSGGPSTITYDGGYTAKTVPTVYAPGLTASVTETCWGSVSAAASFVGVGVAGGATIKDLDCNKRLNASVAWKMDRKDIAFNIMCQEDDFRAAAALTDKPCGVLAMPPSANNSTPIVAQEPTDPLIRARLNLPALPPSK
jgi:hypothetical protein